MLKKISSCNYLQKRLYHYLSDNFNMKNVVITLSDEKAEILKGILKEILNQIDAKKISSHPTDEEIEIIMERR